MFIFTGLASAYLKEMNLTSFWIGANHFTRNTWSWVDGAEWSYTNWAPGRDCKPLKYSLQIYLF